jgi:hypothetical protein
MTETLAPSLFHGMDWITQRQSLAYALDTLDRLQAHCLPFLSAPGQFSFDEDGLDPLDGLTAIHEILDDLSMELDAAIADMAPALYADLQTGWSMVEMQGAVSALRRLSDVDQDTCPASLDRRLYATNEWLLRLKVLLKSLDL